jgi:hypothetical protein
MTPRLIYGLLAVWCVAPGDDTTRNLTSLTQAFEKHCLAMILRLAGKMFSDVMLKCATLQDQFFVCDGASTLFAHMISKHIASLTHLHRETPS